jgi:hypothetical protein
MPEKVAVGSMVYVSIQQDKMPELGSFWLDMQNWWVKLMASSATMHYMCHFLFSQSWTFNGQMRKCCPIKCTPSLSEMENNDPQRALKQCACRIRNLTFKRLYTKG